MSKKQKVKVRLANDEEVVIVKKNSCMLTLSDNPEDSTRCSIQCYLPSNDHLETLEYSQAVNLTMAMVDKLKNDPKFSEMLSDHAFTLAKDMSEEAPDEVTSLTGV